MGLEYIGIDELLGSEYLMPESLTLLSIGGYYVITGLEKCCYLSNPLHFLSFAPT